MKRTVFPNRWLPYLLVLPQVMVTLVFFFWPAAQAVYYSFFLQDAFGLRLIFVGFETAANLAEEAESPKRAIPRAVTLSVLIVAVFSFTASRWADRTWSRSDTLVFCHKEAGL